MSLQQHAYTLTLDPSGRGRAFLDEETENENAFAETLIPPLITWSHQFSSSTESTASVPVDTLILAIGEKPIIYSRALLSLWSKSYGAQSVVLAGSCLLPESPLSLDGRPEANIRNSLIYVATSGTTRLCVVLAGQPISTERGYTWAQTLLTAVSARWVTIWEMLPSSGLLDTEVEAPYLCRVATEAAQQIHRAKRAERKAAKQQAVESKVKASKMKVPKVELLRPPNMVSSLGAHVLARCEMSGVQAELHLSLASFHHGVEPALAFNAVLQTGGVSPQLKAFILTADDVDAAAQYYRVSLFAPLRPEFL